MTKEELIQAIKSMTVADLAELVKALEEEFGVSASAPVAVAAAPAAAAASGCRRGPRSSRGPGAAPPGSPPGRSGVRSPEGAPSCPRPCGWRSRGRHGGAQGPERQMEAGGRTPLLVHQP